MKKIRDVATIIGMLERGDFAADLNREMAETLSTLREESEQRPKAKIKGSVKITLSLEVEAGAVSIAADFETKTPKKIRGSSFYWVTEDGELTTEHPQQTDMFTPREAAASSEAAATAN